MYAMVKNVVMPARSSVVNLAFLMALGCQRQHEQNKQHTYAVRLT